jgi:RNA polymerase sigma factor (sigma-70 family)
MPGTDHKRFSSLIEPHLDALFRAAYRLTRNRADAEDLVQEACVRACEQLGRLRESGPIKSWLLRVMHNLFVDGARRVRASPIDLRGYAAAADSSICRDPTPEEFLDSQQRMAQLERAWLKLERGQRAVLALRAEGYTLAEIASITNIALDALTMRLYRARQNLTRTLEQEQAASPVIPMEAIK